MQDSPEHVPGIAMGEGKNFFENMTGARIFFNSKIGGKKFILGENSQRNSKFPSPHEPGNRSNFRRSVC